MRRRLSSRNACRHKNEAVTVVLAVLAVLAVIPDCSPDHYCILLSPYHRHRLLPAIVTVFTAGFWTTGFNHRFHGNNLGSLPPLLSLFASIPAIMARTALKHFFDRCCVRTDPKRKPDGKESVVVGRWRRLIAWRDRSREPLQRLTPCVHGVGLPDGSQDQLLRS
jgi:hypothetical protein